MARLLHHPLARELCGALACALIPLWLFAGPVGPFRAPGLEGDGLYGQLFAAAALRSGGAAGWWPVAPLPTALQAVLPVDPAWALGLVVALGVWLAGYGPWRLARVHAPGDGPFALAGAALAALAVQTSPVVLRAIPAVDLAALAVGAIALGFAHPRLAWIAGLWSAPGAVAFAVAGTLARRPAWLVAGVPALALLAPASRLPASIAPMADRVATAPAYVTEAGATFPLPPSEQAPIRQAAELTRTGLWIPAEVAPTVRGNLFVGPPPTPGTGRRTPGDGEAVPFGDGAGGVSQGAPGGGTMPAGVGGTDRGVPGEAGAAGAAPGDPGVVPSPGSVPSPGAGPSLGAFQSPGAGPSPGAVPSPGAGQSRGAAPGPGAAPSPGAGPGPGAGRSPGAEPSPGTGPGGAATPGPDPGVVPGVGAPSPDASGGPFSGKAGAAPSPSSSGEAGPPPGTGPGAPAAGSAPSALPSAEDADRPWFGSLLVPLQRLHGGIAVVLGAIALLFTPRSRRYGAAALIALLLVTLVFGWQDAPGEAERNPTLRATLYVLANAETLATLPGGGPLAWAAIIPALGALGLATVVVRFGAMVNDPRGPLALGLAALLAVCGIPLENPRMVAPVTAVPPDPVREALTTLEPGSLLVFPAPQWPYLQGQRPAAAVAWEAALAGQTVETEGDDPAAAALIGLLTALTGVPVDIAAAEPLWNARDTDPLRSAVAADWRYLLVDLDALPPMGRPRLDGWLAQRAGMPVARDGARLLYDLSAGPAGAGAVPPEVPQGARPEGPNPGAQ